MNAQDNAIFLNDSDNDNSETISIDDEDKLNEFQNLHVRLPKAQNLNETLYTRFMVYVRHASIPTQGQLHGSKICLKFF